MSLKVRVSRPISSWVRVSVISTSSSPCEMRRAPSESASSGRTIFARDLVGEEREDRMIARSMTKTRVTTEKTGAKALSSGCATTMPHAAKGSGPKAPMPRRLCGVRNSKAGSCGRASSSGGKASKRVASAGALVASHVPARRRDRAGRPPGAAATRCAANGSAAKMPCNVPIGRRSRRGSAWRRRAVRRRPATRVARDRAGRARRAAAVRPRGRGDDATSRGVASDQGEAAKLRVRRCAAPSPRCVGELPARRDHRRCCASARGLLSSSWPSTHHSSTLARAPAAAGTRRRDASRRNA